MTPRLTILVFTVNGQDKLGRILPDLRKVADELVVGIDDATTDDSEAIARSFADTVFSVSHSYFYSSGNPDHVSPLEVGMRHCRGDWILRVDHDETLSPGWYVEGRIPELLSDRLATHYWVLRRWAVPPGDRFISCDHWYPAYQVRLFRNLPSLVRVPRKVHEHTTMLGEPRRLTHEWLVHWDLVWHSRETREEKVRIYSELSAYTGSEYYLFEGQQYSTLPLDYIPPSPLPEPIVEMRGSALACRIRVLEMPRVMRLGQLHHTLISVQNLSSRVFHPGSEGVYGASARVSYHWHASSAGEQTVHSWDHERIDLPSRLLPGESVVMYLPVRELPPPGSYLLQPDLVEEGIAWASQFAEFPVYPVEVVAARDVQTTAESAEPVHKDGSR